MKERPSWFQGIVEKGSLEGQKESEASADDLQSAITNAKKRAPVNWTGSLDGETLHEYRSRMMGWSDEQLVHHLHDEHLFDDLYFAKAIIDIASGRSVPAIEDVQDSIS